MNNERRTAMAAQAPDVKIASDVKVSNKANQKTRKDKDLEAMHDKHSAAAVSLQIQKEEWKRGYQQFVNERKERAEKLKQATLIFNSSNSPTQTFEERLKEFPALSKFIASAPKDLEQSLEKTILETVFYNHLTDFENIQQISIINMQISFTNQETNASIKDTKQIKLLTLLFQAIRDLQWEAVQNLIDMGVDPKVILHVSATVNGSLPDLEASAKLEVEYCTTPLYYALENRIQKGAINVISHLDCRHLSFIITDLINAKCSLNANNLGFTLGVCVQFESFLHHLARFALKNDDLIHSLRFVMQNNLDVNTLNAKDETPLTNLLNFVGKQLSEIQRLRRAGRDDIPVVDVNALFEIVNILVGTGKQNYITGVKCYDVIQKIDRAMSASDPRHPILEQVFRLIYDDMALKCLSTFFDSSTPLTAATTATATTAAKPAASIYSTTTSALISALSAATSILTTLVQTRSTSKPTAPVSSNWQYRDMAGVLKYQYGLPRENTYDPDAYAKRLMSIDPAINRNLHAEIDFDSINYRFENTIIRSARTIANESCILGLYDYILEGLELKWDKPIFNIVLEYAGRVTPFTGLGHTYFEHVGIPIGLASKSVSSTAAAQASAAATSAGSAAGTSAGLPANALASESANATKTETAAEAASETETSNILDLVLATEIIPHDRATITKLIDELGTLQSPCIPAPENEDGMRKLDGELERAYPNSRLLKVKPTTEDPKYRGPICYRYHYVVKGEGGRGVRRNLITVIPSVSDLNTTVIKHEAETYDPQNPRCPAPQHYLIVRQEKQTAHTTGSKPHISFDYRYKHDESDEYIEADNEYAKISLFKNYTDR